MIKILITGSNGQLGNQFKELSASYHGYDFIFTDLPELDITSEHALNSFLSDLKPDWVINCAAYTAVDKAETESDLAHKINAEAASLLARVSDQFRARLIHISTDYVFDGTRSRPYKEEQEKNPQGVYAQTKSLGEELVIVNNPRSVIIRTSWLYSIYGQNFLKTIIRLASEKGKLRVVADQVGTPTWAGDLVNAIMTLINKDIQPGIYHYSNEGVCSWYDFAKAIVELHGLNAQVEPISTKDYSTAAPRPYYSVLDKTLIKITAELEIPHWRDSLTECLRQLDEQGRIK